MLCGRFNVVVAAGSVDVDVAIASAFGIAIAVDIPFFSTRHLKIYQTGKAWIASEFFIASDG